jgi:hypothetical protein
VNTELRRFLIVAVPLSVGLFAAALVIALTFDDSVEAGPPRIGEDHWHARYAYVVCGVALPNAPTWESGVHTHADGIIHIHPLEPFEEGRGARLEKWFEYGGGVLSEGEVRLPGDRTTYATGEECAEGVPGVVQVYVNEERLSDWSEYIPQDGDRVVIVFGPEQGE